uniref:Uncharacterized protein n=1 Tax=viral metagenome TaxID=1070528 RepID=A0A6M3KCF7_9ZZZZ
MAETIVVNGPQVKSQQAGAPNYLKFTFLGDDTDAHDAEDIQGRGKGRFTVAVDNPTDTNLPITVYGANISGASVGDADVKLIGTFTVTAANAANDGYECYNDPFPYYIVRAKFSGAPTDAVKKNVTVYINFSAF